MTSTTTQFFASASTAMEPGEEADQDADADVDELRHGVEVAIRQAEGLDSRGEHAAAEDMRARVRAVLDQYKGFTDYDDLRARLQPTAAASQRQSLSQASWAPKGMLDTEVVHEGTQVATEALGLLQQHTGSAEEALAAGARALEQPLPPGMARLVLAAMKVCGGPRREG